MTLEDEWGFWRFYVNIRILIRCLDVWKKVGIFAADI
jgi:hypothetical protein